MTLGSVGPNDEVPVPLSSPVDDVALRVRRRLGRARLLRPSSLEEVVADRLGRRREERELMDARAGRPSCADPATEPLVTVRVTTYRRAELLLQRTLPTILAQSYDHLEVLVIGDGTDDDTEARLSAIRDPRVRFVNLPYRPRYPDDPRKRWRVLGFQAANLALDLARGSWIAPCDDDDEFTADHVEKLLEKAQREESELVHSNTGIVLGGGVLGVIGRPDVADGHTSHGALLYSSELRFFRYNGEVWRLRRSLDWDLLLRMRAAGVKMTHLDEVTYRYHPAQASAETWRSQVRLVRPDLADRLSAASA
jgi:hypothetical protein